MRVPDVVQFSERLDPDTCVRVGYESPLVGVGQILSDESIKDAFERQVTDLRARVTTGFKVVPGSTQETCRTLDRVMMDMWSDGWNPKEGNINLFATHFGSILAGSLRMEYGGAYVFRSGGADLASVWWSSTHVEAFPFLKVYLSLLHREHLPLAGFAAVVERELECRSPRSRTVSE